MEQFPSPRTNEEKYLHSILTNDVEKLPSPNTIEDIYLESIAKKLGYLVAAKPKRYTIKTTDWILGSDSRYYYNITHKINSQDIIWSAWESVEGVLTSTVLDAKLLNKDTMQILSDKNTEVKIVINAIV